MRKTPVHDRVASALKSAREASGISQRELAARLRMSQTAVCFIENGTQAVRISEFVEWCEVLRLVPEDVLREARG